MIEQIHHDEVVALLRDVIRQRSDYPPGDCRAAIHVIAQKLSQAGVEVELHALEEHQPNLIASYPSRRMGECLVFHSHVDTVSVGDRTRWRFDPFGGEVHDGFLYGRGAGDDKSSVVAQVMALLALARSKVNLSGTLQVAIVSDEESGGLKGTHWLREQQYLKPDAMVIGEQTNNLIALGERVACGIDLIVYGKSAHGAMPWAGENAVLKTARALTWLQDKLFPLFESRKHPYLPPPTLNIGKIQGGVQWNIVPDWCKVEMDRRLLPGESRETAMGEIHQCLDEFSMAVEPLQYKLISTGGVAQNINTSADAPFVQVARGALSAVCGEERPLTGYVQTSDGRWFASDGIPIIIFGPSDPAVAHSVDERVAINQVVETARFLALLAMRWLGIDHNSF
ncbi:MAG: M20 family metallopeptidase [Anaerolineales bacterium]|nr:M20 family metallopeptidase [Anaerolineales bacterium]